MEFTPRQLDAINVAKAGQDTCVVAGPGSGKTRVLVERYRRLGFEPHGEFSMPDNGPPVTTMWRPAR